MWEAVGAVVGGFLGRSKGVAPSAQSYGHVKGLMKAADKYGINPLTLLNAGIPGGHTAADNSSMGAAIADAAMLLGDKAARNRQNAQLQAVAQQRDTLQRKVVDLTLRPKVPGIYGGIRLGGPQAPAQGSTVNAPAVSSDPRLNDPVVLADGAGGGVAVPEPRLDRGSGVYIGGARIDAAPGWSPAQVIEDEYGDVASWGYGIARGAADFAHNYLTPENGKALGDKMDRAIRSMGDIRLGGPQTRGTPLAEAELPMVRDRLYGKPRDESQRYRPAPPPKKKKIKKHDLHALGF